ncbi:MAG: glycosyltransferase [Chitinispirillaceae bacterium]|nr:glycosyltransferase [Chitinispirillaceae bacterium]
MILLVVVILGAVSACWYCGAVVFLYRGLRTLTSGGESRNHRFSVVIAARNEAGNIGACLKSVVRQSIGSDRYEIIVVDDRSTDGTGEIVTDFQRRYPQVSLLSIEATPPGVSPKKWAVAQGAARSRHEIIVFTDADCRVGAAWLETIDRYFAPAVGLVQGITSYRCIPGMNRLFFRLQSLDFLSHGIVAAAAIGARLPINANANNFAVRRDAYVEAGGLTGRIGRVVSGDDDLLLQEIWKQGRWEIVYMVEECGSVETMPTRTVGELFHQRARWGSKTVNYHPKQVVLLSGIFMFYVLVAAMLPFCIADSRLLLPALTLLFVKYAGESLLLVPGLHLFGHQELLAALPFASLVHLPFVLAALLAGIFGKFTWKDQSFSRTIKAPVPRHADHFASEKGRNDSNLHV